MKRTLTALAVIAVSLFGFTRFAQAWGLQSACVRNVWTVTNPETEAASSNIGPIPAHGSKQVPEGTNSVTASWPSDQTPRTYTRPEGCHAPTTTTAAPTTTAATTTTLAATTTVASTVAPTTTAATETTAATTTVAPATSAPTGSTTPPTNPPTRNTPRPTQPAVSQLPVTGTHEGTALIATGVTLAGVLIVLAARRRTLPRP